MPSLGVRSPWDRRWNLSLDWFELYFDFTKVIALKRDEVLCHTI